MAQLQNQTAVITGAGTGIGYTIAKRFHDEGAFVVLCGRREDVLREAAENISPEGSRVLPIPADINDESAIQNLVEKTIEKTGRIDILVNNAAAMRVNKPPEETSLEEWRQVIDTNVTGTFLCCREVGKVMIKQNGGRIINITSMSASIVNKYFHGGSYEVSKAAQDMLTKGIESHPDFVPLLSLQADLYRMSGMSEEMVKVLKHILEVYPGHPKWNDYQEFITRFGKKGPPEVEM